MSDLQSIETFTQLTKSGDPNLRALGNWALYRAIGDDSNLQKVIDSARAFAGLESKSLPATGGSELALGLLSVTENPMVMKTEEEFADLASTGRTAGRFGFDDALASLYFVQKDFSFIDQRVLDYMHRSYLRPGASGDLIWRVASARRNPQIDQLAEARNQEAYEYYFVRMKDFPLQAPAILSVKAKSAH